MPDQNTTDSDKLQKLGERIRRRLDAQRPAREVRAGRFRDYVREEWQREQQQAKQTAKPIQPPAKVQKRKPPTR
jgi:hypothetical protein